MKKKLSYLVATVLVVAKMIFCGCGRPDNRSVWGATSPLSDSLVDRFNDAWTTQQSQDSLGAIVDVLEEKARESGIREAVARADYCRARWLNSEQRPLEAAVKIEEGIAIQDSVRYPYARLKMRYLQAIVDLHLKKDIGKSYKALEEVSVGFEKIGDTISLAETYNAMARVLREAGETAEGNGYIEKAQKLYEEAGLRIYALKNRLNIAVAYYEAGDRASCCRILSALRKDSVTRSDIRFYNSVLLNIYIYCGDTSALDEAYSQISDFELRWPGRQTELEIMKARFFIETGQVDSSDFHSWKAMTLVPSINDTILIEMVYDVRCMVHSMARRNDSAFEALIMKDRLTRARVSGAMASSVRKGRMAAEIASVKESSRLHDERQRLLFIIILMSVCVVALGVILIMVRRVGRMRLREARHYLEASRRSSQLAVASCALREKENLVEEIRGIITDASKEERMPEEISRKLDNSLRIYFDTNEEWDNLRMLYDSLPVGFDDAVRKRSPEISDSLVRMAAYIACGLTTKQIARLLRIQPDSVKKSRWRLRTRPGLSPSETLEDALQSIINTLKD